MIVVGGVVLLVLFIKSKRLFCDFLSKEEGGEQEKRAIRNSTRTAITTAVVIGTITKTSGGREDVRKAGRGRNSESGRIRRKRSSINHDHNALRVHPRYPRIEQHIVRLQ